MAQNKKVEVRVDARTKADVQKVLKSAGIKMSEAIRIYFQKIINTNSIPFEIKTPPQGPIQFPDDRLLSADEVCKLLGIKP